VTLLVAEIRLGRLQVRPIGLSLETSAGDVGQVVSDAVATCFAQQLLDDPLAVLVSALAELVVSDPSVRVGDVRRRPVLVAERLPDRVVGVEGDRIFDVHVLRSLDDVVGVPFERELGRVDAHHDQPLIPVLLGPGADITERAEPVDARVRPEIDEDDLSLQVGCREGRRVEPAGRPVESRHVTLDR
jgi:hypothetical protein